MNHTFTLLSAARRIVPGLLLPLLPLAGLAQSVTGYTTRQVSSTSANTYNALKPATTTAAVRTAGDADEGYYNLLPIGFTFNFAGTSYTTFSASTNGWMTFGQALVDAAPTNDLTAHPVRPLLAPLWDDMSFGTPTGAATDGNLFYETTGPAGNRICTIEWRNVRWNNTATAPVYSAIVRLSEGSNTIDFAYLAGSAGATGSGRGASMGLAGVPIADYLSGASLSSGAAFSSTTETSTISSRPTSGRQFVFTPAMLPTRRSEELARFQLLPNPASGQVRIAGNDARQPVQLYDNQGKQLSLPTLAPDRLDLNNLAPGLYLVRVGASQRRLLVE